MTASIIPIFFPKSRADDYRNDPALWAEVEAEEKREEVRKSYWDKRQVRNDGAPETFLRRTQAQIVQCAKDTIERRKAYARTASGQVRQAVREMEQSTTDVQVLTACHRISQALDRDNTDTLGVECRTFIATRFAEIIGITRAVSRIAEDALLVGGI